MHTAMTKFALHQSTSRYFTRFAQIITVAVCVFVYQPSSRGQDQGVSDQQPTLVEIKYQWQSTTLPGRVKEALEQGQQHYMGPAINLMELHQDNPDEVLVLFKSYLEGADYDTESTILSAASHAKTKLSLEILGSLLTSADNGTYAAISIYQGFTCQELGELGDQQLKQNLFRAVFKQRDTVEGYLLLSCFETDGKIIDFLGKRRQSFEQENKRQAKLKTPEWESIGRKLRIVAIDLTLAEMGNAEALARVGQIFGSKDNESLRLLLRYLKFVENKAILRQTVELLKDESIAIKVEDTEGEITRTVRICDLAFFALGQRTGTLLPQYRYLDEQSLPHFSDQELNEGYKKFKLILKV